MDGHLPATCIVFEGRADRFLGVEAFPKKCRQAACGVLVAGELCDRGGRIHVE
jgi:hypothetical protein